MSKSLSQYKYDDEDVLRTFKWFRSFIRDEDWERRKTSIENYLKKMHLHKDPLITPISEGTLLVINDDKFAWYLYLVDTLINNPFNYEYFQGARVLPIFKRIGLSLNEVQKINGINKKVRELTSKRSSEADSILFEILTATLWVRNGWDVTFLPEGLGKKSPDFLAIRGKEKWEVECKRLRKTPDYSYRETEKRQKLISYISEELLDNNLFLDIIFHVELITLPDTYLRDLLKGKLICKNHKKGVISNSEVYISISSMDILKINNHLSNFDVKVHSPQFYELLAQRKIDNIAFTSGHRGNTFFLGNDTVNNLYIDHAVNAFAVITICDAEEAINAKAKDISAQIYKALTQFTPNVGSVIHIGLETFDGATVEEVRQNKISNSIYNLKEKEKCWIFINYFQSYSGIDDVWTLDETSNFATSDYLFNKPIKNTFMILPEDADFLDDTSHWNRNLPT